MPGRVLVVDDIPQNVKLLEAKLANEYYTVFSATSGQECLDMVKEVKPDIILLDVMMPGMDGFEVCMKLKADLETTHIPVVMVTALSEQKDRVHGLQAGASDFITKPIDEVHLFARVKSLIRLKTMLDELRLRDKTGAAFGMVDQISSVINEKPVGTIMVIDDDIVQAQVLQENLVAYGHRVQVEDPEDALSALKENVFDLVIVSTMLDDTDALRLSMEITSQSGQRQLPIMIIVDEDDKALLVKGLDIGIDDYLITPLDPNELIARAESLIRRKRYQDMLRSSFQESVSASIVDSLTQLFNRRYLDAHLPNMAHEARAGHRPLSLMTIDIDHFKQVNDRPGWGHHIGDEVLVEVANRIRNSLRSTDLPTRPGGEEFIVVMPNTDLKTATAVAERTRRHMEETPIKISAEPGEMTCQVSIGVSALKEEGQDSPAELCKRSDEALYEAKNTGRNKVIVRE